MHIILLSGGAGTRLWPLSNSARSKQFLKLLNAPDGSAESIIQRLFRQLEDAGLSSSIIVSTNTSQRDAFISQIEPVPEIIAEPSRRDTFAAIALACAYLYSEKHVAEDEAVVVIPCDQFVDESYFDCVKKIADQASKVKSGLVLMGIKPTHPSSKFGYIIPSKEIHNGVTKVKEFKEKPSESIARKYIAAGALWNGGVFGFQLGFVLNIVKEYFHDTLDFSNIYNHFETLPKISFDYEVVEKADNIQVIEYCGNWDDLGTWPSLAAKTGKNEFGKVIVTPTCNNYLFVNELNIPLIASGLKNTVVIASYDGILVSKKEDCDNIKEYITKVQSRPLYEERRWGTYKVIDADTFSDGLSHLTKNIVLKQGCSISYQLHRHRSEVWTIVNGNGLFVLDGIVKEVKTGDVLVIQSSQKHAIKALTELTMIEVQLGSELVENDIERFDWNW